MESSNCLFIKYRVRYVVTFTSLVHLINIPSMSGEKKSVVEIKCKEFDISQILMIWVSIILFNSIKTPNITPEYYKTEDGKLTQASDT